MSPAIKAGDRLRMEEVLGPELVRAIHEQCRHYPVRPDRWHQVPAIARPWETTAAAILAERIQDEQGVGWKSAIDAAAVYLDLPPDTVQQRLKRGRSATLRRAA